MPTTQHHRLLAPRREMAGGARRSRLVAGSAMAVLSGLSAAALFSPRPATGAEVIALMAGTLAVGVLAGVVSQSRWAGVLGPVLHLATYELARVTIFDVPGPTLDRPRFDVTMGVLLFLAVHVMYAVVAVPPMVLGSIVGVAVVRHRLRHGGRAAAPGVAGHVGAGLRLALAVLLAVGAATLAVQLVRPGRVAPVLDAEG